MTQSTQTTENQQNSHQTKHLITIDQLPKMLLMRILNDAENIIQLNAHTHPQLNYLQDKTLVNLFFESSTRTRVSFELAAKRLGATVINIDKETSALKKGENIVDMLLTLQAMHCHFFVIRHPQNHFAAQMAKVINGNSAIINAGDGTHAHPSQALTDIFTIMQHKNNIETLKVAIIGDIIHSRVAKSQIAALQALGVKKLHLIAPATMLPQMDAKTQIQATTDLRQGLEDADVIIVLRIQKERMITDEIPNSTTYHQRYGLTTEKLGWAKADAILLHPGPVNRDIEIDTDLINAPQSLINQQVTNSIAVRMAILKLLAENLSTF